MKNQTPSQSNQNNNQNQFFDANSLNNHCYFHQKNNQISHKNNLQQNIQTSNNKPLNFSKDNQVNMKSNNLFNNPGKRNNHENEIIYQKDCIKQNQYIQKEQINSSHELNSNNNMVIPNDSHNFNNLYFANNSSNKNNTFHSENNSLKYNNSNEQPVQDNHSSNIKKHLSGNNIQNNLNYNFSKEINQNNDELINNQDKIRRNTISDKKNPNPFNSQKSMNPSKQFEEKNNNNNYLSQKSAENSTGLENDDCFNSNLVRNLQIKNILISDEKKSNFQQINLEKILLDNLENYFKTGQSLCEKDLKSFQTMYPKIYEKLENSLGVFKNKSINNKIFSNREHQLMVKQNYLKILQDKSNINEVIIKPEFNSKFETLIVERIKKNPKFKQTIIDIKSLSYFNTIKQKSGLSLLSILGEGGFSTVYEALSLEDGNMYAVKLVNKVKQPPKYVEREITANKKLKNLKFVLQSYKFVDINNETLLISLEKADICLDKLVKQSKGLNELQTWFFFSQILEGIINIHSQGIIHRDLKPENILIKDYMVKISDYTTAKFIYDDNNDTILGTRGFMSPESGSKDVPNVYKYGYDIYALGIIFYFMVFNESVSNVQDENIFDKKDVSSEYKQLFKDLTKIDFEDRIVLTNIRQTDWYRKNKELFFYKTKDTKYSKGNYELLL